MTRFLQIMSIVTLGTVASSSIPGRGWAQGGVKLDEVEVTAERVREAERRAPTTFVSVVEIPERDAPLETTADVLSETPGVQVQRYGGLGAFSTISIRGSTSNQVPVYLDGIRLSQSQDQSVNLSDLPLDSLARIEVYRGTIPVGFGGGGIGGVVNLVTLPAQEDPRSDFSVGYGSFDTRKVVATHSRRLGATSLLAHVSYLGSRGDFSYFDDNGTPENRSDDGSTTRINNELDAVDALLKATHELDGGMFVDVVQEVFSKDQGVPGPASTQFSRPELSLLRTLTYLRMRHTALAGGDVEANATLFATYGRQGFSDPQGDFGVRQDSCNTNVQVGGSSGGSWAAPWLQTVSWSAELAFERFSPSNENNPPVLPEDGPDQERLRLSLALQDQIALVADRLWLVPTLRYDHLRDEFSGVNLANFPITSAMVEERNLWTPSIGAHGQVASWLGLRANIGRFQRAPNFSELFGNAGTTLGNAGLKPETGINRDVGALVTWPRVAWCDAGRLEYVYFHNDVDDLIAFEQYSPKQFRAFNVGDTQVRGHEVSFSAGVLEHFGVDLNYTHQDSENRSVDSPEGNQLPLRPADDVFLRSRFYGSWGTLYYQFARLGENPTDADNFEIVEARTTHTVGWNLQALPWLALRFEAANLADADIRDLGDFPLPGRSFFGGLKAVF